MACVLGRRDCEHTPAFRRAGGACFPGIVAVILLANGYKYYFVHDVEMASAHKYMLFEDVSSASEQVRHHRESISTDASWRSVTSCLRDITGYILPVCGINKVVRLAAKMLSDRFGTDGTEIIIPVDVVNP